ncbi:hypothetical protein ACOSQ2_006449 [Xanthoceras sorbifolium]
MNQHEFSSQVVQIVSKKLIKPATPTPPKLITMKISSLDQLNPSLYLSFLLFYPAEFGCKVDNQIAKNTERSKLLEESLSQVLTLFYPLAGRYTKDDLFIDCNDHGVEYVEARVSGQLVPFLSRDVDSKQLIHLVPFQSESPTSPLVAVQFNTFDQCGGVAIGLSISHKIADGFVMSKFIDRWAVACRVGIHDQIITNNPPRFDLALLLPTRDTIPEIKPVVKLIPGLKTTSRTFLFHSLVISNLRDTVVVKEQLKWRRSSPSRVQLVTAVIWKALIRLNQAKHGKLRPSVISNTMNLRGRCTVLPISENSCGNLYRPVTVQFVPKDKEGNPEFQDLVSLLSDSITDAVNDCTKPQNGDDLFSMVTNAWREAGEEFHKDEVDAYGFTSMCRMPLYADFGWGKPIRVTHVQSVAEMIMLFDTRDGDGIEAWINLDENDMQRFLQDPHILAFTCQA